MIRQHHERYDGSGYPDGLAGQEISLAARIVAVADAAAEACHDHPDQADLPTIPATPSQR